MGMINYNTAYFSSTATVRSVENFLSKFNLFVVIYRVPLLLTFQTQPSLTKNTSLKFSKKV
jgi:hypothetical protein